MTSKYENADAESQIDGAALFDDVRRLWIDPEIVRRQADGRIAGAIDLRKAQIIFHLDHPPIIRLNDEVRGALRARLRPDVSVVEGDKVLESHIDEIERFVLTEEEDPDCAHLTAIRYGLTTWFIAFDLRYNSGLAHQHLCAAHEFLEAASTALAKGNLRPLFENLFAVAELCAKARLMLLPLPGIRDSKRHGLIRAELNRFANLNAVEQPFAKLLNDLEAARTSARYLRAPMKVPADDGQQLYADSVAMYLHVRALLPPRLDKGTQERPLPPLPPAMQGSPPTPEAC